MSDTLDRAALETAHAAAMYEAGAHIHEDAIAAGIAAYLAASPQPQAGEPVAWGCFRDGVMVGWIPGPDEPEGREYRLPEDSDERRPLYASPQPANPAQVTEPSDDLLAFCITETLGERCATFDADCYTCQAWSQYDCLKSPPMPARGFIDEGLEILGNLADNIARHGNYSPESTRLFIDQAGQAFRKARTTLIQTADERVVEALRPFADMADYLASETEGFAETDEFDLFYEEELFFHFTVADFRRAHAVFHHSRAILSSKEGR